MKQSEIKNYLDMASRRKWWFIFPFLLSLLGGLTAMLILPKVYEAETLVLVQRQKVPEHYVQEIVSTDLPDRLNIISQQVTSRSNLETIIDEFHLYAGAPDMVKEEKVEKLRARISIKIVEGGRGTTANAFSIAFRDESPRKAMEVTNALASNFISENLKIREAQAIGTSNFLAEELEAVRTRLKAKETLIMGYRKQHIGTLPGDLETNLSMLTRYQSEVEELNKNLRDAENRKLIIQEQLAEAERSEQLLAAAQAEETVVSPEPVAEGEGPRSLSALRRDLKILESRYTPRHPDVIKLKGMIAQLEKEAAAAEPSAPAGPIGSPERRDNYPPRASDILRKQLAEIELTIADTKAEIATARERRAMYQRRVEETPEREQELTVLRRDYDNLKALYDSLLDRKLEAEISVNLEKKQKGEQFRIVDVAKLPRIPVEPDLRKILLMTLVLGLGLGGGLAYLREMMDASFKTPDDAEHALKLPVLVSLSMRYSPSELRRQKWKKILSVTAVTLGFAAAALTIIITTKGLQRTLAFANELLANMPWLGKGH